MFYRLSKILTFETPSAYEGNRSHFEVRIFLSFLLVGFPLIFLLSRDAKTAAGYEGLWFQVCGATVLWWEANCGEKISGAIAEIKSYHQLNITNRQELSNDRFSFWSSLIISITTFFVVFVPIYSHNFNIYVCIIIALIFALANYVVPITIGNAFGRLHKKTSENIMRIGSFEDINKKGQEDYARRVVRSIGFILFIISALMQIIPIAFSK